MVKIKINSGKVVYLSHGYLKFPYHQASNETKVHSFSKIVWIVKIPSNKQPQKTHKLKLKFNSILE